MRENWSMKTRIKRRESLGLKPYSGVINLKRVKYIAEWEIPHDNENWVLIFYKGKNILIDGKFTTIGIQGYIPGIPGVYPHNFPASIAKSLYHPIYRVRLWEDL